MLGWCQFDHETCSRSVFRNMMRNAQVVCRLSLDRTLPPRSRFYESDDRGVWASLEVMRVGHPVAQKPFLEYAR
nr:hypothetical protein CFP56_09627 [Quercus suber]